jgi:hypothetical protein
MAKHDKGRGKPKDLPDLDARRWKVGAVAWSPEGHIVILDPALGRKLEALRRKRKSFVLGLPPPAGVRIGKIPDNVEYKPFPIVDPKPAPVPQVLSLCVCPGGRMEWTQLFEGAPHVNPEKGR